MRMQNMEDAQDQRRLHVCREQHAKARLRAAVPTDEDSAWVSVTANLRVPHPPFHPLSIAISPKSLICHSAHSRTQPDAPA
jgi:hypothetical protein